MLLIFKGVHGMTHMKRQLKASDTKHNQKVQRKPRTETNLGHKERFNQLLDDAVLGVKKK